jgi:hypothetical protein
MHKRSVCVIRHDTRTSMNHSAAPQPTRSRVISLLWFPFYFAVATAVVYSFAYTHLAPHDMRLGVIGTAPASLPPGISVEAVTDTAGLAHNQLAGVYDSATSTLYAAPAASASRANYLTALLHPAHTVNVVPLAHGDLSGVGVFVFGLPILLVGMITTLVLLQFGMWPTRKKVVTIAATGAFAAIVAFAVAASRDVIPADGRLVLYCFMLTQAIGWLTTALSRLVKQFFLPVAMTFVLILNVPTSGGSVNADMLPTVLRWLHDVLPFGQFIEAVRADAYFGNHGLTRPLIILAAWVVGAALLLAWVVRPGKPVAAPVAEPVGAGHQLLHGMVRNTGLVPVSGATVLVLDDAGNELHRTATGTDGGYAFDNVRPGLHHLVVTAAHHEPEIVTIAMHRHSVEQERDITLTDWEDPAGNLTAEEIADRRATIG